MRVPLLLSGLALALLAAGCGAGSRDSSAPASEGPSAGAAQETEPPAAAPVATVPEENLGLLPEEDPGALAFGWSTDFSRHTAPLSEFESGGPGKDGIPAIDAPRFVSTEEAGEWLEQREPVIELVIEGDARAYPLRILIWHEIANDEVGSRSRSRASAWRSSGSRARARRSARPGSRRQRRWDRPTCGRSAAASLSPSTRRSGSRSPPSGPTFESSSADGEAGMPRSPLPDAGPVDPLDHELDELRPGSRCDAAEHAEALEGCDEAPVRRPADLARGQMARDPPAREAPKLAVGVRHMRRPPPVDAEAADRESLTFLAGRLRALPMESRTPLVLRDLEGWSYEEVADALELSVPAVKSRIHRARMQIAEDLSRLARGARPSGNLSSIRGPPYAARVDEHPIRLVVSDDLRRSRLTVFFRLLLVIPHLIWLTLWGFALYVALPVTWLAVLVLGRSPAGLHGFIAAYARYWTHVNAYLFLLADPYPAFTGTPGSYPVDLEIDPPAPQGRLGVLFRLILSIPAWILASVLQYVIYIVAFLGWFICVFAGRMPEGMRNLSAYCLRYYDQTQAYTFLLTSRYPSLSAGAPGAPA